MITLLITCITVATRLILRFVGQKNPNVSTGGEGGFLCTDVINPVPCFATRTSSVKS